MRRWNGWGDSATTYPLPAQAVDYLAARLGPLQPRVDAALEEVLKAVPRSRLAEHAGVKLEPEVRLRHARGQSLPDWVALRYGRIGIFPDGVAFPQTEEDVADLMAYASQAGVQLIPYGGGTSVVGHINPLEDDRAVLTMALENLKRLLVVDELSGIATFEAGVTGPEVEAQLRKLGYTLGHFPQSFEFSTLGGWIATRSSGQQSFYYGRIEQLFAGGRIETPRGRLDLPVFPASAAGPDLRELVLGSEGRLGVITRASVRVRRLPEAEEFSGVFFPTWEQGLLAVRSIAQSDLPVSMLRLSDPQETETTLALLGKRWLPWAESALGRIGFGDRRCLLVFGVTGARAGLHRTRGQVRSLCRKSGGLFTGGLAGRAWQKSRFLSPYLRNTLWDTGIAADTLETALPWSQVEAARPAILQAIQKAARSRDESVIVLAHLSHIYRDGASIYVTYLFRHAEDADEVLERWRAMKQAASLAIQEHGGTISHQHGVGCDHAAYLQAEKGALGMEALRAVCQRLDPEGMMNPGKLLD